MAKGRGQRKSGQTGRFWELAPKILSLLDSLAKLAKTLGLL